MPARQLRISSITSHALSATTSREPFVIVSTVSGADSTAWISSGLTWIVRSGLDRRWRGIMRRLLGERRRWGRARRPHRVVLALAQLDQVLEHLVGGGDDAPVGLEAALRLDHVRELGGEVDVRHLERAGRERAEPVRVARNADGRRARVRRLLVLRAGERLQPGLVREAGEGDL